MNSIQEERHSMPSERLVKHSFLTFLLLYSFHHPFVESIAKQFWNPNQPLSETTHALVEAYR
ncbi:hypothetical protein Goklo_007415 [Gossypium klotzschianum]|uniref:Uncharacterized protein n=1 Tax=Gossypium klotzschianum TaxID=34286 RepID=A0A7J8WDC5_9ROSI|nr:hypothetical protein [Gossypium klotzschianum]